MENKMKNILLLSVLAVFLTSCGSSVQEIQVTTVEVSKTPLNIPDPDPLQMYEVDWIIVTKDNAMELFEQLKSDGGEYSVNYPQNSDPIYFRIYDASQDIILHFDSEEDLDALGIIVNKEVDIFFEGGIHVSGKLINKVYYPDNKYRRLRMLSFEDCTVTHDVDFQNKTTLFQPDWGTYDMVLGERITSAFCGPASYDSLEDDGIILSKQPPQIEYSDKQKLLHNLYKQVRIMRDKNDIKVDILQDIFLKIRNDFSGEWLLVLEIYELLYKSNLSFEKELLKYLESLKENIQISNLISTGLKLIRK